MLPCAHRETWLKLESGSPVTRFRSPLDLVMAALNIAEQVPLDKSATKTVSQDTGLRCRTLFGKDRSPRLSRGPRFSLGGSPRTNLTPEFMKTPFFKKRNEDLAASLDPPWRQRPLFHARLALHWFHRRFRTHLQRPGARHLQVRL